MRPLGRADTCIDMAKTDLTMNNCSPDRAEQGPSSPCPPADAISFARNHHRVAAPWELTCLFENGLPRTPIRNELLYELMTYGEGRVNRWKIGNWNGESGFARQVLTWLAQRAFNVHRLPGHPDRSFTSTPHNAGGDHPLYSLLSTPAAADAACSELLRLHSHTVQVLRSAGITHVRLQRAVRDIDPSPPEGIHLRHHSGYASRIVQMALSAKRLNRASISFPTDVLTSWSGGGYPYPVRFSQDVPIDNIAWCSSTIEPAAGVAYQHAVESGEWVVLNRDPRGLCTVKTDDVDIGNVDQKSVRIPANSVNLESFLDWLQGTYGTWSSMRHDYPAADGGIRLKLTARVKLAWEVLRGQYK